MSSGSARPFHRARRLVGLLLLAVFLALPFIRVGGESALRFDVPTLRLHVFGLAVWMQDFFLLLVAGLALAFAAIFLTVNFGRLWCGWACPQTVLVELTGFARPADPIRGSGPRRLGAATGSLTAVPLAAAVSAAGLCYFVSPYELPGILRAGGRPALLVIGIWGVLALALALELLFLRRGFCARVCPYARLQGVLFDDRTLVVAFDGDRSDECMKCAACVAACPMGIDIRKGAQLECIHCAECVDACAPRMAKRGLPSLVRYSRGYAAPGKGSVAIGRRTPLLISGAMSLLFLALLVTLLAHRPPFEASIHPIDPANALVTGGGAVAVRCAISLRNLSPSELSIGLVIRSRSGTARASRESFSLPAGSEALESTVTLVIRGVADPSQPIPIEAVFLSSAPEYGVTVGFTAIRGR